MRKGWQHNGWAALMTAGLSALFTVACGDDGGGSSGGGSNTTSCPASQELCDDVCASLDSDPAHCGSCDNACSDGQSCVDGECTKGSTPEPTTQCPDSQEMCDGVCATLDTDRDHCGSCDVACDAGETCDAGKCVVACPASQVLCDGECVNPDTSRDHCGASDSCKGSKAGEACTDGNVCQAGSCVPSCSPGLTECNGGCVDLNNDPDHCGSCESACSYPNAAGVCVEGSCGGFVACTPGFADCDGAESNGCEINLEDDRRHCGSCDNRCALMATCDNGECAASAPTDGTLQVSFGKACKVVDHDATTGDDHGGIAVAGDYVYITGDDSTARMNASNLANQAALGAVLDGLVSDLSTGTLYTLGDSGTPHVAGNTTVSQLLQLDTTGAVTATIPLSESITVSNFGEGIFAGPGFMLLYTNADGLTHRIDFATGAVTSLGDTAAPSMNSCETWASWGVAEAFGGEVYMTYSDSSTALVRTKISDGSTETVLAGSYSDMCSLSVSLSLSRWYWHYEDSGPFGGSNETAGYCSAEFLTGDCIDTADLRTDEANCGACGNACGTGEQCNDGVCDACEVFGATNCSGECVDVRYDADNCGACGNECGGSTPYCIKGACGDAAPSCADIDGPSGVYWLAPAGSEPFQAYCEQSDMAGQGGGWTLLAVFSNSDADNSWSPMQSNWIAPSTFGTPTDPTVNADAKSPAFDFMNVDELMIVRDGEVQVVTATSCVGDQPLTDLFKRSSESDADCAHQCDTVVQADPWSMQTSLASGLRFRCMDEQADIQDSGGYMMSSDDNSFITTLDNNENSYNFGLGAGESSQYADWDSTSDDAADLSDSTQVLLYGR